MSNLRKVLGGFSATAISIGGMIGSGIFFLISMAAGRAGPAIVLSFILAGVVALLSSLSFATLSSKIPKAGGEYQFIYAAYGSKMGFLVGFSWILTTILAAITVSSAFGSYVSVLFPVLPSNAVASASVFFFMVVEILGLRLSSRVNNLLVLAKVSVLLFFIVLALMFFNPSNFEGFLEVGPVGVFSGAFLLFFSYPGFEKVTAASEEVKDCERVVPRAIVVSLIATICIYTLVGVAAVGAVGANYISTSNAPLASVMQSLGFDSAFFVIAVGGITAMASVMLVQMLSISRIIYAMSINRQLPSMFGKLHPKFKTPYKGDLLIGTVTAIGALFLSFSSTISWTSLIILVYYALINIAAILLRQKRGSFNVPLVISILGFILCILFMFFILL